MPEITSLKKLKMEIECTSILFCRSDISGEELHICRNHKALAQFKAGLEDFLDNEGPTEIRVPQDAGWMVCVQQLRKRLLC